MFNDHISDHPQHPINLIIFFITVITKVLFEFMIKIMIKIMVNVVIRCAECVAIGECGLDFNRNFSPPEVQIEVFEKQVIVIKKTKRAFFNPSLFVITLRCYWLVNWENLFSCMSVTLILRWSAFLKGWL